MATAVKQYQMFVGGEWVPSASGETQPVISPSSGEVIAVMCVPGSTQPPSKHGSIAAVAQVTMPHPATASCGCSTATILRPVRSLHVFAKEIRCSLVGL